jgi:hypothetical protein
VFAALLCREAPLLHCQPTCFLSLLSIAASSTMEGTSVEYSETTTVTLEWTLPGLKSIFESRFEPALVVRISVLMHKSSKGDTKSKVTKSARFGADGRWQILFYANSGSNNGPENASHVSLYLSCEVSAHSRTLQVCSWTDSVISLLSRKRRLEQTANGFVKVNTASCFRYARELVKLLGSTMLTLIQARSRSRL